MKEFYAGDSFREMVVASGKFADDSDLDLAAWTPSAIIEFLGHCPPAPRALAAEIVEITDDSYAARITSEETDDWPAGRAKIYITFIRVVNNKKVIRTASELDFTIKTRPKIG